MFYLILFLLVDFGRSMKFVRILNETQEKTVDLFQAAILTCRVVNLGDRHVTWLKFDRETSSFLPLTVGEQVFLSDGRYSVWSNRISSRISSSNLEISRVDFSDRGIYQCQISSRRRVVSRNISLNVRIPMIVKPSRMLVREGDEIELDCLIFKRNVSSIRWFFSSENRTKFYPSRIDQIYREEKNFSKSQLIIRKAEPRHSGTWMCSYNRQRRTATIVVVQPEKTQRISFNRANRTRFSATNFIFFLFFFQRFRTV